MINRRAFLSAVERQLSASMMLLAFGATGIKAAQTCQSFPPATWWELYNEPGASCNIKYKTIPTGATYTTDTAYSPSCGNPAMQDFCYTNTCSTATSSGSCQCGGASTYQLVTAVCDDSSCMCQVQQVQLAC
jgi:hypothetical protein